MAQVDHCMSEMLEVVQAVADGRFDTFCTSLGLDDGALGALGLGINIMVSDTAEAMQVAKNEQRRVELILRSVPDPVFTVDHEMCITFMSPATEELTGVPLRDARGMPCSELFRSGLCNIGCPLKEATASGHALQSQEIKLHVRDDVEIDALISVGALTSESGKLSGGVAIIRDITEQKQREREQKELQQQIIAAQARSIEELSTPIIPIMNRIIVMPLIGNIDTNRAKNLMRNLLAGITLNRAKVVIIDVTGVAIVDTAVASRRVGSRSNGEKRCKRARGRDSHQPAHDESYDPLGDLLEEC